MSYAEYGSKIFFIRRIDTKLSVGQDELFDKHLGCRLKMQDSCLDIRAWSLNQLDYCRYFREVTELETSSQKIIQKKAAVDPVEFTTDSELEFLRRELAKYKSLSLTPEQKKQLGQSDIWTVFSTEGRNLFESFLQQFEKFKGYKEALLERAFPGSFAKVEEIHEENVKLKRCDSANESWRNQRQFVIDNDSDENFTSPQSSSTNIKLETDKNNASYTGTEQSDNSSDYYVKSKSTIINEDDIDNINSIRDSQTETISASFDYHQQHTLDVKSRMIVLEKDISAKNAEIEEMSNSNSKLRLMLENRNHQINNLHDKLARTHSQLTEIAEQRNFEVDELKMKLSDGKILIDQLKRKLEEQRLQYSIQMRQIEHLKYDTSSLESLRNERDSLARKLAKVFEDVNGIEVRESIDALIHERKALKEKNEHLEIQCSEQEEEIDRLSKLIDCIQDESDNQCLKMDEIIVDLKYKIDEKNERIANYANQLSTKSLQQNETLDEKLDQSLENYLKGKVNDIKKFSACLDDAWNCVERGKMEVDNLRRQMSENERIFHDNIEKMREEVKYYHDNYEDYKKIVESQMDESEQFRTEKYTCKNDEEVVDYLKKVIQEMELKLTALHKENFNLLNKNENLSCKVNETSLEIMTLGNDNARLLHEINSMNVQLDEKNLQIDIMKGENLQIAQTLKDTKNELVTMFVKSNSMKLEDEKINSLAQLQEEIIKDDKEKRKLEETIVHLRNEYEAYQKKNKRLENNLANTLHKKESLELKISATREDITKLSIDYKDLNIYSDENLMNLPKKIGENIKALKQRPDSNIYSERLFNNHNYNKCNNDNNDANNVDSYSGEISQVNNNIDNNCDELLRKEQIIQSLADENRCLSSKLNAIYEDYNKILKRLENESGIINDSFRPPLKQNGYNNINDNNYSINSNRNNIDQKHRISPSAYFDNINPSFEKNIEDFSKVTEQCNYNVINNCRIFPLHNGTHGHIKSKQRYTHEEIVRPENSSCKDFIRNCSERRNNNENY